MNHLIERALIGVMSLTSAFCIAAKADPQPPKLRLPETIAPESYKAQLTLDPAKDSFEGKIQIKVNAKEASHVIWLDGAKLTVSSVVYKSGGQTMKGTVALEGDDFIGLKFDTAVPVGPGEIDMVYQGAVRTQDSSGVFRMLDNGNKYLYTQFESTDARDAFPCFDEPSYKVPWQLTLTVPSDDTAISNTEIANQEKQGGQTVYTFRETKPLPSYLVAFGVGPFDYVNAGTAGRNHIPVRIITPKGHAEEAKYAAEVTSTIITRLENYFDIPFPYSKSDQVAIPVTFGFGAMENAGMVTYAQTIILAKPEFDTTNRQRGYASVAAHELAHQWFGDLVTTAWWNDIWLNEAFATWMEQKILREWKPEWNTDVSDVTSKLYAEGQDSLVNARKIRQEIQTKDDISNAFDGITYQKGAAVIGMFENWVGPEQFRKGVKAYLTRYSYKNGTAPLFLDAISTASKRDVTTAFSTFLNQAGVPLVSMTLDCKQSSPTLHLSQQRFLPLGTKAPETQTWQIPMCVRYGSGTSGETSCELMTQPTQDLKLKTSSCPAWVEGNNKGTGYYFVDYQGGLLNALTAGDVDERLKPLERVDFMGNASALSGAAKVSASDALSLVQTFASDPTRQVVTSAVNLATRPVEHEIPENLMPNYHRFVQKNFDARARQIGWTPKPGEDDDIKLLRPTLEGFVATDGDDQELASEANSLAQKWLANHKSVDPNLVGSVLNTAAYFGDKAFFDQLASNLKTTKDRQERQRIIRAMSSFRDEASIEAGFNAILSGEIPFIEGAGLLFGGQGSAATRKLSFEFLKTHYDEILAKRPTGGGFDFGSELPYVGASYCDASSKAELKDFFEPRVDKLLGARRTLNQVLEGIDVCIAETAEQKPSVEAFLKKY